MTKHYLYVIAPEHGLGGVKVGLTNNVQRRLSQLQTGHPERLKVFFKKEVQSRAAVKLLEEKTHVRMAQWRMTGEWFDVTPEFAQTVLQHIEEGLDESEEDKQQKVAQLQEKLAELAANDERLTECLSEAKKLLDDVQAQWAKNLQEWQKVREELNYHMMEDIP